jgi:hypothetical protein
MTREEVHLEEWEHALRDAVLRAGAGVLSGVLARIGSGESSRPVVCACGTRMVSRGLKGKELLTILGPVPYLRSAFLCPTCGKRRFPADEALDVVETTRSPGLRRMMARAGSQSTFKEAAEDLKVYAGVRVSAKDVERVAEGIGKEIEAWTAHENEARQHDQGTAPTANTVPILYVSCDGTGVPMTATEVAGRKGKQPDGSAKTREAKLGCVFTQTTIDEEGRPVRDPDSTTFIGSITAAESFGWDLWHEASRRGLDTAGRVVVLGDGAEWIRTLTEMHFPGVTQIVDLYHAREHVASLAKLLHSDNDARRQQYRIRWWYDLDAGNVEKIVREATALLPDEQSQARKSAETEIAYLRKNAKRMRYALFRHQHLFVGSGVMEAGCKTLVGQRLKRSGMEWSVPGANAIIALRCLTQSHRFDEYWNARRAA